MAPTPWSLRRGLCRGRMHSGRWRSPGLFRTRVRPSLTYRQNLHSSLKTTSAIPLFSRLFHDTRLAVLGGVVVVSGTLARERRELSSPASRWCSVVLMTQQMQHVPWFIPWILFGRSPLLAQCVNLDAYLYYAAVQNVIYGYGMFHRPLLKQWHHRYIVPNVCNDPSICPSSFPKAYNATTFKWLKLFNRNTYSSAGLDCTLESMSQTPFTSLSTTVTACRVKTEGTKTGLLSTIWSPMTMTNEPLTLRVLHFFRQCIFIVRCARSMATHMARRSTHLQEFGWEMLNNHPPFSPDLAPTDLNLFLQLKKFLSGQNQLFQNDERQRWVSQWFQSQAADFDTGYKSWSYGMTNVSIPEVNKLKNSSTLAVSVPINLSIKFGFVSVNGTRETYFVNMPHITGKIAVIIFKIFMAFMTKWCKNRWKALLLLPHLQRQKVIRREEGEKYKDTAVVYGGIND